MEPPILASTVVRDKDGKPYSVRYDQGNAMLLKEFLKEHRKVLEQAAKIEQQETAIAALNQQMQSVVARLAKQDAKIQRVNDPVEITESEARVVAHEP